MGWRDVRAEVRSRGITPETTKQYLEVDGGIGHNKKLNYTCNAMSSLTTISCSNKSRVLTQKFLDFLLDFLLTRKKFFATLFAMKLKTFMLYK